MKLAELGSLLMKPLPEVPGELTKLLQEKNTPVEVQVTVAPQRDANQELVQNLTHPAQSKPDTSSDEKLARTIAREEEVAQRATDVHHHNKHHHKHHHKHHKHKHHK